MLILSAAEAYVGRGTVYPEVRFHARGKQGIMEHPTCTLWVRVKEIPKSDTERRLGRFGTLLFRSYVVCCSVLLVLLLTHCFLRLDKQGMGESGSFTSTCCPCERT